MRSHELAKKLLSLPDTIILVQEPGDALFSITELKDIDVKECSRKDGWLYYEYDPRHDKGEPIKWVLIR